jgi:putative transcriptional regulator
MTVAGLLEQVDISPGADGIGSQPVFNGGPVQQDRGFVLHRPRGAWKSTLSVRDRVWLTTSRDILEAIAAGEGPGQVLVSLGYAGWGAGQLEQELAQNAWLTVPAGHEILFEVPSERRLDAAMAALGIDFTRLHDVAGHA